MVRIIVLAVLVGIVIGVVMARRKRNRDDN